MVFAPEGKPREPLKQIGNRIRESLADYVIGSGANEHGGQRRVLEEAIDLHKLLKERLTPVREQLLRAAGTEGLAWPSQENELFVRLIERALGVEKPKRK